MSGFVATYEELKDASVGLQALKRLSFVATYEELKGVKQRPGRKLGFCFVATYEELKEAKAMEQLRCFHVLLQPMRS